MIWVYFSDELGPLFFPNPTTAKAEEEILDINT